MTTTRCWKQAGVAPYSGSLALARCVLALAPLLVVPGVALAQPLFAAERAGGRFTAVDQPFAWTVDPSTPAAGGASLSYRFGLSSGVDAERPLPVQVGGRGFSHAIEVTYGFTDRVAPFASGTLHDAGDATAALGAKLQRTAPGAAFRATVMAAGMREGRGGDLGAFGRVALAYDTGSLRFAGNFHAEKVFAVGRDQLDIITTLGTSWQVLPFLRVGLEYVGQDLEDAFSDDLEGGARHVVGPDLALDLSGGRYQLTAGVGAGIGPRSPGLLVRAGFSTAF